MNFAEPYTCQLGELSVRSYAQLNIQSLLMELSRPQVLHLDVEILSKLHIWNHDTLAVSLETQPTFQITGDRKDGSPTYFNPTICWCHLNIWFSYFVGVHDMDVLRC